MNFLSHYYVGQKPEDPYYLLGVIMPDLWKRFSKLYNRNIRDKESTYDEPELHSIEAGLHWHFQTDKAFHALPEFEHYSQLYTQYLQGILKDTDKHIYLLGHVLFELMLDRILLKNEPQIGDRFYELLQKVDNTTTDKYLNINRLAKHYPTFFRSFERFRHERYLLRYLHNEQLVYALSRVYWLVSKQELTDADQQRLTAKIDDIEADLLPNWKTIFERTLEATNNL